MVSPAGDDAASPSRKSPGARADWQFGKEEQPSGRMCVISTNEHAKKERAVPTSRRQTMALFVDRSTRRWIVRDPEGNFWLLPSVENSWDHRQPFQPTGAVGVGTGSRPL